jgi:hypothetical protein
MGNIHQSVLYRTGIYIVFTFQHESLQADTAVHKASNNTAQISGMNGKHFSHRTSNCPTKNIQ